MMQHGFLHSQRTWVTSTGDEHVVQASRGLALIGPGWDHFPYDTNETDFLNLCVCWQNYI